MFSILNFGHESNFFLVYLRTLKAIRSYKIEISRLVFHQFVFSIVCGKSQLFFVMLSLVLNVIKNYLLVVTIRNLHNWQVFSGRSKINNEVFWKPILNNTFRRFRFQTTFRRHSRSSVYCSFNITVWKCGCPHFILTGYIMLRLPTAWCQLFNIVTVLLFLMIQLINPLKQFQNDLFGLFWVQKYFFPLNIRV